jgi:hypothetical protein
VKLCVEPEDLAGFAIRIGSEEHGGSGKDGHLSASLVIRRGV